MSNIPVLLNIGSNVLKPDFVDIVRWESKRNQTDCKSYYSSPAVKVLKFKLHSRMFYAFFWVISGRLKLRIHSRNFVKLMVAN
jgi:hypothetical protein